MFQSMLETYAILIPTFMETARQDCIGFGNIKWLTEGFTCLDRIQLKVSLVVEENTKLLFQP